MANKGKFQDKKDKFNDRKGTYQKKKGRNNYRKDKTDEKAVDSTVIRDGSTDPTNASWYWDRGISFEQATKVPFDILSGTPLKLKKTGSAIEFIQNNSLPNVMTIGFVPCMGRALNTTDPINRSMVDLEAKLLASRTSPLPFTRASLTMLYLNYSTIGMMLGVAKRALEVSYVYARDNLAFPQMMLRAMGFDPTSIIEHQNEIIPELNDLITWYNSFTLPNSYPIFQRHYELATNVYKDSYTGVNGVQYYVFHPVGWYEYVDVSETVDTPYLDFKYNNYTQSEPYYNRDVTSSLTITRYLSNIRIALQAWSDSSDFAYVRGAILNAMQKGTITDPIISLSGVSYLDPMHIVVDDKHIMNSIHNMTMTPVSNLNVTEDPIRNVVVFEPHLDLQAQQRLTDFNASTSTSALAELLIYDALLDSLDGDTSPDFVMTASRLKVCRTTDATSGTVWGVSCGTEIVTDATIWYFNNTLQVSTWQITSLGICSTDTGSINAANTYNILQTLQYLSAFQYAPRFDSLIVQASNTTGLTGITSDYMQWQVNYTTRLTASQLEKLHTAALQSVFFPVDKSKGRG